MKSLENIDLNLLLLLHWLLVERSVTKAGKRVGLSQPAASRALARLRHLFNDELLVQTGRTLVPTKLATHLAPELETALSQMRRALTLEAAFDPRQFEGVISFASNDYLASVSSSIWTHKISAIANNLNTAWRPLERNTLEDVISGRVDFILAPDAARPSFPKLSVMEDMVIKPFLNDNFVLFGSKSHPVFRLRRFDISLLAKLDQIMVSPTGSGPGIVDDMLAEKNLTRNIRHRTSSFLHAAELALSTQCVAVLPSRLAQTYPTGTYRALPFKVPAISSFIAWHSSRTKDPSHKWIRQQLLTSS